MICINFSRFRACLQATRPGVATGRWIAGEQAKREPPGAVVA